MTPAATPHTDCPSCEQRGKPVKPITVDSLVRPEALQRLEQHEGWRFCASQDCTAAYFHETTGEVVAKADVRVRIGQKELEAPRTVCYCFQHTHEEIEAQILGTGRSSVGEAITEHCRQGLDRCPETNPQGSCCLGNVRALERAAATAAAAAPTASGSCDASVEEAAADDSADCCASPAPATPDTPTSRSGTFASLGAMTSAILSSACCWLPLLLLGFGVSAGSVAGFLDAYRPWLLGATGVLLAGAFYLTYFRKPECATDGSCTAPPPRLVLFNKVLLWVATAVVLAFALFPNYVGLMTGEDPPPSAHGAAAKLETVTLDIQGMTCEACEVRVRAALREVPGVHHAQVSYAQTRAVVQAEEGVDPQALVDAVGTTGYQASIVRRPKNGVRAR